MMHARELVVVGLLAAVLGCGCTNRAVGDSSWPVEPAVGDPPWPVEPYYAVTGRSVSFNREVPVALSVADVSWKKIRTILFIGDSLTASYYTYVDYLFKLPQVQQYWKTLGLKKSPLGGQLHQGHPGFTYRLFIERPDVSPFGHNGKLDIPAYLSKLGTKPDVVVFFLGTNDCFNASETNPDERIDLMFSRANGLQDKFKKMLPGADIWEMTVPPGNARDSAFARDYGASTKQGSRHRWEGIQTRLTYRFLTERSKIIPVHLGIDRLKGYADMPSGALHPNRHGYGQIAEQVYGFLANTYQD